MERPRLTGDWGGVRDELGKKGIVFDADLMMVPRGVISGGKDTAGLRIAARFRAGSRNDELAKGSSVELLNGGALKS